MDVNNNTTPKKVPLMYIEEPEPTGNTPPLTVRSSTLEMIPENASNMRIGEPRMLSNLSVPSFAKLPTQMNRENSSASRLGEPRMLYNLSNSNFEDLDSLNATTQVRRLLEDEGKDGEEWVQHMLFIQMDVLARFPHKRFGWKEIARWLKYEETVDVGDRWSKPHIPTTQMHSLIELRKFFAHEMCIVALDVAYECQSGSYQIADTIKAILEREERFKGTGVPQLVWETTIAPHKHQHRKWIGKMSTKAFKQFDSEGKPIHYEEDAADGLQMKGEVKLKSAMKKKKNVLRKRSGDGKDIAMFYTSYPPGATPDNLEAYKPNKHLKKKLPEGVESASVLVGQTDYIDQTFGLFLRMKHSSVMGDLIEVDTPAKFVFLLLGPMEETNIWEFQEIGRTVGTLFSDRVFVEVAYKAHTREDLINGVEEYIDDVTVLPPSIWEPSTRIEPPVKTLSLEKIHSRLDENKRTAGMPNAHHQEEGVTNDISLQRTGRFCGGLINDIKSRYKHYLSDISHGLSLQALASTIFLFFACITPIVTFGGLMGQKTHGYMGTMETLLSGAICGTVYALFSGQPLTIIGATGPLLVFESILYRLCQENSIGFMPFRFWIGFWVMIILLIIVAFDLSYMVRYITRFTEESFAILISIIFIYESFTKIYEIYKKYPVRSGGVVYAADFNCVCVPDTPSNDSASNFTSPPPAVNNLTNTDNSSLLNTTTSSPYSWSNRFLSHCINDSKVLVSKDCVSETSCLSEGWTLLGEDCHKNFVSKSMSDVFMLSVILFIGTFALAIFLKNFRTQRFFPSRMRSTMADFAVFVSVVTFTLIDIAFGVATPKLNVPSEFVTTRPGRSWVVNPMGIDIWWLVPFAIIPAVLATILIFLDQQITAVIVNRKEHKLKKGHGYHLDLFVLSFLIMFCSMLGLPWFVAATVRSVTHVRSLMMESEVSAPGERPQMIGVREQRLTGFLVHLLVGLSTLITVVLRLIPMPVLYGVFLYMGFTSLYGVQFVQRIGILFMPAKYQPDYTFLRHVQTLKVHAFTIVQIVCFVLMWVVKQVKAISIAFPLMLIALIVVRKLLDYIFTQSDLYWLDHLLPEEQIRHQEDVSNVKPPMHPLSPEDKDLSIDVNDVKRRKRTRSSIMEDQKTVLLK